MNTQVRPIHLTGHWKQEALENEDKLNSPANTLVIANIKPHSYAIKELAVSFQVGLYYNCFWKIVYDKTFTQEQLEQVIAKFCESQQMLPGAIRSRYIFVHLKELNPLSYLGVIIRDDW